MARDDNQKGIAGQSLAYAPVAPVLQFVSQGLVRFGFSVGNISCCKPDLSLIRSCGDKIKRESGEIDSLPLEIACKEFCFLPELFRFSRHNSASFPEILIYLFKLALAFHEPSIAQAFIGLGQENFAPGEIKEGVVHVKF